MVSHIPGFSVNAQDCLLVYVFLQTQLMDVVFHGNAFNLHNSLTRERFCRFYIVNTNVRKVENLAEVIQQETDHG